MATLQAAVHAIIALQGIKISSTDAIIGLLCLIALSLLAVLPLVRRYAYEAFLYSHLALAIILAIVLWEHLQLKRRFSKILLLLASVSFLITSALSYLHQAYRNISWTSSGLKLVRACWSQRFGDSLIVELKLSRSLHVIPGQHIFLTFLTLRYGSMFQRHPLMVTWWRTLPGETEARSIFVVIRQQRGWTRRLLTSQSSFTGCAAWIDGPFGTSYDLQEYGTVLMFASGDGIFAQLPFIKSLTEDSKRAAIKTRRIKLVWQTEEYHGQLQQWMQSILDDEEVSLELLDISIHIPAEADESNLSKVVEVADSKVRKIGNRLKVIRDIPDVESYVQLEMKEPRRDVAVTVSGFEKLREEVRSQVLATGRLNVQLFELDFQPQRVFQHRGGTAA